MSDGAGLDDDPTPITRELLFRLLDEMDEALDGQEPVMLLVVGGAPVLVVAEHRTTFDVDVAEPALEARVKVAAHVIRERHELAENWLNDAFRFAFPQQAEALAGREPVVVFTGKNLTVTIPPVRELMRLKLAAGRDQDIRDLAELMAREANRWTIEEWATHLEATFGEPLTSDELARLMEAFFEARQRTLEREQEPPPERDLGY